MVRSKVVKREREMLKSVESREMDKTCQQEMFWQSDSKLERHWNWTHNQANPGRLAIEKQTSGECENKTRDNS
jgi:hypothetical protein